MSLLTAWGELRCTATLSSQGDWDDGMRTRGEIPRGGLGISRKTNISWGPIGADSITDDVRDDFTNMTYNIHIVNAYDTTNIYYSIYDITAYDNSDWNDVLFPIFNTHLISLSLPLSLLLTRSPSLLYLTLYSLPIHSYVFNRMSEIMLKDLKPLQWNAVALPSSLSVVQLLLLCLPPNTLLSLNYLALAHNVHSHRLPTNIRGPTRTLH